VRSSSLFAIICAAVVAYAAADAVHELGHALAAWISGVTLLSISSVAVQTGQESPVVAAAGTSANVAAGLVAFALIRTRRFAPAVYCLWLFGFVSCMNTGYLVVSALVDSGDWASVVAGLHPPLAWRLGMGAAGAVLYSSAIYLAAFAAGHWVANGDVSIDQIRRISLTSYMTGGFLLVLASAFNPIGFQLVAISGVGTSFGLTAGLLVVPPVVRTNSGGEPSSPDVFELQPLWIVAAVVVGVGFVFVLGPGVRLAP